MECLAFLCMTFLNKLGETTSQQEGHLNLASFLTIFFKFGRIKKIDELAHLLHTRPNFLSRPAALIVLFS